MHTIMVTRVGAYVVLEHGKILVAGPFETMGEAYERWEECCAIARAEARKVKIRWCEPDDDHEGRQVACSSEDRDCN